MKIGPERNHLLALMSQKTKDRIFPLLREFELSLGTEIYAPGRDEAFVYFPADCIVSLLYVTLDGHSAEIAIVGCDGIVGIAVFMGGGSMPSWAVVQSAGKAYRLPATDFKREFENNPGLRKLMLHYTLDLINQMAQTAVCNRHHSIVQQLCRWLLLSMDRLPTNDLVMTQELIAHMLGVRREGVTEAARKLKKLGVIQYRRGHIAVLDRARLEELCCECYTACTNEVEHMKP